MAADDLEPPTPSRARGAWVGIVDAAHAKIAPKIAEQKRSGIVDLLDTFEADVAPKLKPFVADLLESPDVPDHVKELLRSIAGPEHFSESIIIGIAVGAILSPVLGAATQPIVQSIANTTWPQLPNLPLSPDLLAAAVIKGVLTEAGAAGTAAVSGTSPTAFATMVATAGQSIGTEEALLLLRRGQIDQAEFERIMRYSNVRNDFIPDALLLKYSPPPAGEVIAGALKAHLSDADAQKKLGEAGIDPTNFQWMKDTAGRPPGVVELLHLWNRQVVDEAFVDQAIAQSDINPNYTAAVKELRHYFPPPRSIVPMLRSNSITESQARTLLTYYGVDTEWVDAFIKEAQTTATSAAKELTMSQVVAMYRDRFIPRAEASTRLTALKFPADQITLILDYADDLRVVKLTNALMAQIGTLYVAHKLTKSEATVALNGANIPAAMQADLFEVWDLERAAKLHHPTVAQVVGAFRRTVITAAECKTRLTALGVQPADLEITVADGWPPGAAKEAQAAANAVINA